MKKRVLAIAATAMATMMMASPVMAQDFKIGICNYVDDASLNQIVDNIQSRLEEIGKEKDINFDVSYDNCNADANVMEQIISDFQADNVDLMVGIATPVAMRMQSATEGTDTPVVFSAVSDPVGAGLAADVNAPGSNITGTSDAIDTAAIFDLMLPGMDGLEAIRKIRANDAWKKLPVLVLTAKDKEYDKVAGLDGGADDYMTKPFSVLELLARVRSLLRRTKEEEPEQPKLFDCGALHLDLETREVKVNGREILLTYKEYELLVYLAENQNRVVSRDELLDKLWDWRADVETRTLDIHIKTLRQKLGEEAGHYIKTVRSVGYRFMKPQE